MEPTGKMGFAGFDVLWRGESDAWRSGRRLPAEKMQLAGSKMVLRAYTNPVRRSQNGNSGL